MTKHPFFSLLFSKAMWRSALTGSAIAFTCLMVFLLIVSAFDDGSWILLPMLTVSVGGAMGGAFFFLVRTLIGLKGWKKAVVTTLSVLAYCVIVWVSFVGALAVLGFWD